MEWQKARKTNLLDASLFLEGEGIFFIVSDSVLYAT